MNFENVTSYGNVCIFGCELTKTDVFLIHLSRMIENGYVSLSLLLHLSRMIENGYVSLSLLLHLSRMIENGRVSLYYNVRLPNTTIKRTKIAKNRSSDTIGVQTSIFGSSMYNPKIPQKRPKIGVFFNILTLSNTFYL